MRYIPETTIDTRRHNICVWIVLNYATHADDKVRAKPAPVDFPGQPVGILEQFLLVYKAFILHSWKLVYNCAEA